MKLTQTNQWRVYYVWPALFPVSNGGKSIKAGIDGNVSVKCIYFIFFKQKANLMGICSSWLRHETADGKAVRSNPSTTILEHDP